MLPEFWLVITVAAAFLLLGVAGSPLAWAMLTQRRLKCEQSLEQTARKLAAELRSLEARLNRLEILGPAHSKTSDFVGAENSAGRGASGTGLIYDRGEDRPVNPTFRGDPIRRGTLRNDSAHEPTLIAIPNLDDAPGNRQVTVGGLRERYAAIWALAEKGGSAETIARATGQPVGQIELILALRRQVGESSPASVNPPRG
jgi:hypothetical protein